MFKKITHKNEMYAHILEGIEEVASIVGRTLGPGGLPILIERSGQSISGEPLSPMITKDGVTVAGECFSEDPLVDVVIQSVKDICRKTNRVAGDGTTTAIVLGRALLEATMEYMGNNPKANPQEIKDSVEVAIEKVISLLGDEAVECKNLDMIEHVASISANGDAEIGKIIRDAFDAVGTEGIITVDEGGGKNHTLEVVDGFQIRRGAEAQDRFFNNNERTKFEAENVHVVMYDGKLTQAAQVMDILKVLWEASGGKMPPVLFMANEFSMEVLQVMLINKAENGLSVCAIRTPHQTKVTTAMLDDMAVFLGGERLGNGNRNLASAEFTDIGVCNRVVVDKYNTTFFGGHGEESAVLQRIDQLKAQRETAESTYDSALISDRIAALAEGIAKIGVGGLTDFEVKEKYHRIEDAVNAVRAAISEGVVAGGGSTLLRISDKLSTSDVGEAIVKTAIQEPFYQILENIGIESTETKVIFDFLGFSFSRELDGKAVELAKYVRNNPGSAYDGKHKKLVDAVAIGIIDPVKVTKTALKNAASISALLSTCGGSITYTRMKQNAG